MRIHSVPPISVSAISPYGRDPRTPAQYFIDKTFEAIGGELDRLENEKPGTRRKLGGAACFAISAGAAIAGSVLMFT